MAAWRDTAAAAVARAAARRDRSAAVSWPWVRRWRYDEMVDEAKNLQFHIEEYYVPAISRSIEANGKLSNLNRQLDALLIERENEIIVLELRLKERDAAIDEAMSTIELV